jgi:hypothetical protein
MKFLSKITDSHFHTYESRNIRCKPVHHFYITKNNTIIHFLKAVYPYLIIKKEKAMKAIKLIESNLHLSPRNRVVYAHLWFIGFTFIWNWMYSEEVQNMEISRR